jgi:hypothetical protein
MLARYSCVGCFDVYQTSSDENRYRHRDDGGSILLCDVGKHLTDYMGQHLRR